MKAPRSFRGMTAGLGVWWCQAAYPYWWTACGPEVARARRRETHGFGADQPT